MGENFDDQDTPCGFRYRAIEFVEYDNKHEFVRLFNRVSSDDKESVIIEICHNDAANCLAAILDGEAGDECLTLYLSDVAENMPLHYAARKDNPRITSLLLDKGFSADLRTDIDCPPFCLNNVLPLNVSLDYFRFQIWQLYNFSKSEPWISPIYQIMDFCQMASNDATTRLIARKTTEIKHEFFKYLKQGKVFEVGALLAIASDLIMSSSSTIDGENDGISFKNIMEMRQFLLAEISQSLGASNTQLREMKKTLRLLEIFDRIGDRLVLHMPMWDYSPRVSGLKVGVLIEEAASTCDEEAEVEYDHDAVPSAYYPPYLILSCDDETSDDETSLPDNVVKSTTVYPNIGWQNPDCTRSTIVFRSRGQNRNCTRKFSTKVHFPSWLKEGSSHDNAPLPLPTTLKGTVTKHVLSKKHASFTGAFAKAVRRLRYF